MKNNRLRWVCALAMLAAANIAQAQTYSFNQPMDDDSDTVLRKIVVSPKQTLIFIELQNTLDEDYEACAHRAGEPDAFTLEVLDTGKVLQQTGFSGLPDCRHRRATVAPGQRKTLQLRFPSLPAGATSLKLGERSCQPNPNADLLNWCFEQIELPAKR